MAAYVKVAGGVEAKDKGMNIGTDQWAFALAASVPSLSFVSGTTDLATGGGYTAGGANVATTSSAESAGTLKLILAAPVDAAPVAPVEVEPTPKQPPKLDKAASAYIDSLFASIEQAKKDQERARLALQVVKASKAVAVAQEHLAKAIEAEEVARQEMQDFDLAFVAAVLAQA